MLIFDNHHGKQPVIMSFDKEGRFDSEEQLDLCGKLIRRPEHSWEDYDVAELLALLAREIGLPVRGRTQQFSSRLTDAASSASERLPVSWIRY